ncbi:MAG: hypothetical protein IIX86_09035 [Clostridia bacterium]|nr:hypothetical protein [Clostridia bacterium]
MRYPKLREIAHDKQYIDSFGGYNHNVRIGDGEFYDVVNMTSDAFPLLKVRDPHGVYVEDEADGMISKDELCYVSGGEFIMGDSHVDLGLSSSLKTLVSMGAYVIIFPDKKYVNTADLSDYGSIAAQCGGNAAVISNCTEDGTQIPNALITISETQPETGKNGYYWINTSTTPATMFRYSGESGEWFDIKGYLRISSEYITDEFSEGDSVRLDGFFNETLDIDGYHSIVAAGRDATAIGAEKRFIAVQGVMPALSLNIATEFTISRDAPDMDFVIEANNRLWGCKYGYVDGKLVNEIYASKLGDFRNWRNYAGISTDSYAASVGTDGPFTGAVNYVGFPLFFKERCVHKVYGTIPSNFQIQTDTLNGVQEGCAKSLAVVNEVLYYKSRSGICAYDGSLPTVISEKLGDETYGNAVGGSFRSKYFITMRQSGISYDFIYDTARGIWHRSHVPQRIVEYCAHKDEMYFLTDPAFDGSFIGTVYGQEQDSDLAEKKVYWTAESGMIGLYTNDKKALASLSVRIKVALGTRVRFYAEYDSSGCWEPICSFVGTGIKVVNMPIIPRRCDHFRIKIEGEGPATLFSICKTIEEGTEL